MKKIIIVLSVLICVDYHSLAQCGFNNNTPTYFGIVTPQIQDEYAQLLGYPDVGTYFQIKVIKGLSYQVYLNRDNLSSQLRLDIYDEFTQQWLAGSAANTGNPSSPAYNYNAYINWQSTISGTIRINISDAADCSSTNPHGLPVSIKVSGSNTLDDANARGITDFTGVNLEGTWIEHVYDEPTITGSTTAIFNQYIGYNIINSGNSGFEQNFNSGSNPDSYAYPVLSNGAILAGVLTSTFSTRYRTAMTICGSYRFRLYCDDGARVYVDGNLAVEDWADHGAGYTNWYAINNYCGTVNIDIEYYDNSGDNIVRFEIEKLSIIPDAIAPVINNGLSIAEQYIAGSPASFQFPDVTPLVRSLSIDNITPVVNLKVKQSIAVGSLVNTRYADVTAEVKDLNGNTSNTIIRVINTSFSVLPLRLLLFSANRENDNVIFKWKTADENNVSHFEIMQSLDGHNYSQVYKTNAKGGGNYSAVVKSLLNDAYYILRTIDIDGKLSQSQVIVVPGYNHKTGFLYNISRLGNVYYITNKGNFEGAVKFNIITTSGVVKQSGSFQLNIAGRQMLVPINNSSEIFFLQLISADGKFSVTYKFR